MKRVLITGIGGFAGHHMMEHFLLNTDWEIVGIDSFRHKGVSERVTDSKVYQKNKDRVSIYTHDLTAPISEQLKAEIGYVNYIIQNASESHVDRSISEPVTFIKNNVDLILNVLEYARWTKPEHVVIISTDEVYGAARDGEKHREWSVIKPSNPYSASKAAQEAIAISYWRTYGVPITITNTMNLIGERQDTEKFVPMVINKVRQGLPITIHGTPDNIGARHYLHCRNQADAQLFILQNIPPKMYPESEVPNRFNVVGEKELNNLEMAELIAKYLNKPLAYEFQDFHATRPGHDRRYALDGTLLDTLGWKPPTSLEESLERTVKWTTENPRWLT